MSIVLIADAMTRCGFEVKIWKMDKLFVSGYGRELKISIAPGAGSPRLLDGAVVTVTSTWRSTKNALYCKGVKHALMQDLYHCGLITAAPPADWRHMILDDRTTKRSLQPLLAADAKV